MKKAKPSWKKPEKTILAHARNICYRVRNVSLFANTYFKANNFLYMKHDFFGENLIGIKIWKYRKSSQFLGNIMNVEIDPTITYYVMRHAFKKISLPNGLKPPNTMGHGNRFQERNIRYSSFERCVLCQISVENFRIYQIYYSRDVSAMKFKILPWKRY